MSTHNLCFRAKIRRKCIPVPCKPQFYYIKVGCKGVYITRTCLHDVNLFSCVGAAISSRGHTLEFSALKWQSLAKTNISNMYW